MRPSTSKDTFHVMSYLNLPRPFLCSSCKKVFRTCPKEILQDFDMYPPETVPLHSPNIQSLSDSKSLSCHLCLLLWEARAPHFSQLLKQEKEEGTKIEIRWKWMNSNDFTGLIPIDDAALLFFIVQEKEYQTEFEKLLGSAGEDDQDAVWFWLTAISDLYKDESSPPFNITNFSSSTASEESNALCKSWISYCISNHEPCSRYELKRKAWNPTRVLDVGLGFNLTSAVRLWHSEGTKESITYTTLSHRWGKQDMFRLLKSNMQELVQEIPMEKLSKTFQEAIMVTRRLGVRYLWIDSICIIQDSVEDWRFESSRMGNVYKYGYCNLAATGSSSGHVPGCYATREALAITPLIVDISRGDLETPEKYYVHRQFLEWDDIDSASLNQRAWVLQERMMSPRTLHFCRNQILFECCTTQSSETWPKLHNEHWTYKGFWLKPSYAGQKEKRTDHWRQWYGIMRHYSKMEITVQTDRLAAISGIADSTDKEVMGEYLAGLWSVELLYHMLWRMVKPAQWVAESNYVAPSWSWAAVMGQVRDYEVQYWQGEPHAVAATVLNARTTPVADPLGQVKGGFIKIKGQFAKGVIGVDWTGYDRLSRTSIPDLWFDVRGISFDTNENILLEEIYCLPLFKYVSLSPILGNKQVVTRLMLLKTGRDKGEFKRCGLFTANTENWSRWKCLLQGLKKTSEEAGENGIPFEKNKKGVNEFVVTIV